MKVSLNWLKRHVDLPESAEEIEKALTAAGLEVEGKEEPGKMFSGLVVAKVLTCEAHPDSDHLHVTTVNDGKDTLQVVCGAPNAAAGQTVVFAPIGTELPMPNGEKLKLKKMKIRGVESNGMICAEDEIGLSENHDGILVLDSSIPAGTPFVNLGFYDTVFELNVTPNRPDALSHRGVARELAAKFGRDLKPIDFDLKESADDTASRISLEVVPNAGCSCYVGRVIENVKVAPSPEWLRRLLSAVGLTPINNVVDITNFILMDIGQPLHSFDMNQLSGNAIKVRRARDGEKITTIDHRDHELKSSDLAICDGDRPACVAGVMGGVESEITDKTVNVFLESAYFNPTIVRKQSKRLGISSDSSYRFERGIDPFMQEFACNYASALIGALAAGTVLKNPLKYVGEDHPKTGAEVWIRVSRAEKVIGIPYEADQIRKLLTSIGLSEKMPCAAAPEKGEDTLTFVVPGFRPDLEREVDLIEEVARLTGFDQIPYSVPSFEARPNNLPADEVLGRKIRYALSAMGLHECLSLRFSNKAITSAVFGAPSENDPRSNPAPLLNPLSEELGVLPTSLVPMMLKSVAENEKNRPGSVRLFEVGKAQFAEPEKRSDRDPGFKEVPLLCAVIAGHWKTKALEEKPAAVSFADMKGLLVSFMKRLGLHAELRKPARAEAFLHPEIQAEILCGKQVLGFVGNVHPSVLKKFDIGYETYLFEINLNQLEAATRKKVTFTPFSKQVPTSRDISLEVDKHMTHESILAKIKGFNPKNLAEIQLKSIYEGEKIATGKKNLVYSLVYQAMDRTLTDDEVNKTHNKLREKLVQSGEITLR
ncbi:MAG: phenylalanine--tRNA ligase subunit beta [Fibrobacter sp.]|jgi:phenylalanyl-tRNA synthetase beta chain|nr:phenylalanine--tRNA ligase subunit beta [Fibrobacter sp.]